MIILLGRLVYILVWIFLIYNLIHPLATPANLICYVALATLVLTHGLQAWLLNASLTQQEKTQDKYKVLRLFLFGAFESLSWKKNKK